MYLSGSKWNVKKRKRRSNPWRVLLLLLLIAVAIYVDRVIVPRVPPLFIPTPTPTRSPVAFVEEAEALLEAGNLDQAEAAYNEAIAVDPDEPAYYIELARIQVFAGKYEEAETSASNALLIEPESTLAKAVHAWVLDFRAGESSDEQALLIAKAKEEIESVLEVDPTSALAHAYYAEIIMDNNLSDYELALEHARNAVQLAPNLMEGHRALGYVWQLTGNWGLAIEAYDTALRISPNLAILHISIGDMYLAEGQSQQANESYRRAVALSPKDIVPYQRLALSNARIGEFGMASQWAEEALRQDPSDPMLHGDLGRMYYKNNELGRAVEELGLAIHGGETPGRISIEGREIRLAPQTQILDAVEVGDTVIARVIQTADDTLEAVMITKDESDTMATQIAEQAGETFRGVVDAFQAGAQVSGLAIDPARERVVEFYYTYGLALAKTNQCGLARQVAQALLTGVPDNLVAVRNAEEILIICGSLEP